MHFNGRSPVRRSFLHSFAITLLALTLLAAQDGNEQTGAGNPAPRAGDYSERPDQPYTPVSRDSQLRSPAYRISSPGFVSVQVNIDSLGQNIVGDAANEPSIAVDPNNPARMAIGWRQFDTVNNNFRQAGFAFTSDSGQTWAFPGVIEPGVFRSDPVLSFDSQGNFYYNSLTVAGSNFNCDVFRSQDGGVTWDNGAFAQGGDKQWMAIDRTGGLGEGHVYAYWTQNFSVCFPGFFTRSTDEGASYQNCTTIPNEPFWGTLDVGPGGELYVGGSTGFNFVVAKSSTARDSAQSVSWDFATPVNLGGSISSFNGPGSPNPDGLLGQTWIAVDRSGGPNNGNVYLLCSVEPFSGNDPLDVMFSRSTDGGLTWSTPIRINDDLSNTAWQWFGTMSVAPTGRIDVVWLDTRDNPGSFNSSLYYSFSSDGGLTWSANERLSTAFDPHLGWPNQNKMGDYFDMVSDSLGAHLAWAATFNGEQDVYYGRILTPLTGIAQGNTPDGAPVQFRLAQNYPNPFNPATTLPFRIANRGMVKLTIYDAAGREVKTLVREELSPGEYEVQWDGADNTGAPVSSGVYLYRINAANKYTETRKMVLMR